MGPYLVGRRGLKLLVFKMKNTLSKPNDLRSLGLVLNNEAVTMCQIFTSLIGTSLGGKKL